MSEALEAAAARPPDASVRRRGLPMAAMVGYGTGNFAFALLGLVVAVNLQFFYTDYVGLSAAWCRGRCCSRASLTPSSIH
jgi:hypothetical protein